MDKRKDPRFPFRMKAFPLSGRPGSDLETQEVSAGGALFAGDPGVPVGESLWVRLELGTQQRGRDSLFPLFAEVRIVRLLENPDQGVTGFGARWLRVFSRGDVTPLREFLRRTLSIASGFVQTIPPAAPGEPTRFLFAFPNASDQPPASDDDAPIPAQDGATTPPDASVRPAAADARPQVIYATVPLTWTVDDRDFEGRTVKMSQHAMRVSTDAELPPTYRRVTLTLPTGGRGRHAVLTLTGTVTTRRPPVQEGDEGLFEVSLTLGNDPESLHQYRTLLDRLGTTMGPAGM